MSVLDEDVELRADLARRVPWVPYRWGSQNTALADSVVRWTYDQSAGWTAYSRVAVDNGLTMEKVAG